MTKTTAVVKHEGRILATEKARIEIVAPDFVREAIARLGRTEDVRFSPSNRKLAIAGFAKNVCLLLDVEVDRSAARPVLRLNDCLEIHSNRLREPHGLEFIGEDLLLVANRRGTVTLFTVPARSGEDRIIHATPLHELRRAGFLRRLNSPGSLCVLSASDGRAEILVCNNYSHRITRHVLPTHDGRCRSENGVFLRNGLRIPDGIAINADQSWLAISNHDTNSVLMFDLKAGVSPSSEASGHLVDVGYPHGIRFSRDGRRILVADAGAPLVHAYEAHDGDWRGERKPVASMAVLDEKTFLKGRVNPEEGGPKGIDINNEGDVLAVTCHEQPLVLFHLQELL